jgi:hypothetical protein
MGTNRTKYAQTSWVMSTLALVKIIGTKRTKSVLLPSLAAVTALKSCRVVVDA